VRANTVPSVGVPGTPRSFYSNVHVPRSGADWSVGVARALERGLACSSFSASPPAPVPASRPTGSAPTPMTLSAVYSAGFEIDRRLGAPGSTAFAIPEVAS
jgi:hypothetical protein